MDTTLLVVMSAGFLTGVSKFTVGGMGVLLIPLLLLVASIPETLAILIVIYVFTDVMTVLCYRQHVHWPVLRRMLPMAAVGVILGGLLLDRLNPEDFFVLLGLMILGLLLLGLWMDYRRQQLRVHPLIEQPLAFLMGFVGIVANAAGPLFSLYLVELKSSKESFSSTRAWMMLLINLGKAATICALGYITPATLQLSLLSLPGLIIGMFTGYALLKRIPPLWFKWLIRMVSLLAILRLLLAA